MPEQRGAITEEIEVEPSERRARALLEAVALFVMIVLAASVLLISLFARM
ncbi:MAG TPA: hypothetical protein PKI11_11405 [Candidatus Hydrogenedentes bacterium]|nr:hypothetical protein [Candidatus Hydrogenedentota bacterium]HNT87927.1 hypothetical protein [Candidatus Hydrogenedentota bacterium]